MSSLYMGCVSYSRQFFSDGVIDAHQMKQAELAARREIEVIAKQYRKTGWKEAYGSSGTAKALFAILTEGGMSDRGITRAGLSKLKDRIVRAGRVVPSELPGIKVERADVLPGGLAIMSALFDELGIEVMHTGDGALRLGVLYDLLGRDVEHDKRDESVRQFMKRYHVDANQARRVHHAALSLFDAMMPEGAERAELRTALAGPPTCMKWACRSRTTRTTSTRPTCWKTPTCRASRADQQLLALLALGHQGKLSKLEPLVRNHAQWTAILSLRLAVLLFRRRGEIEPLPLTASVRGDSIVVRVNKEWLAQHPLSDFTLRAEEAEWSKVGFSFQVLEF